MWRGALLGIVMGLIVAGVAMAVLWETRSDSWLDFASLGTDITASILGGPPSVEGRPLKAELVTKEAGCDVCSVDAWSERNAYFMRAAGVDVEQDGRCPSGKMRVIYAVDVPEDASVVVVDAKVTGDVEDRGFGWIVAVGDGNRWVGLYTRGDYGAMLADEENGKMSYATSMGVPAHLVMEIDMERGNVHTWVSGPWKIAEERRRLPPAGTLYVKTEAVPCWYGGDGDLNYVVAFRVVAR